MFEEGEKVWLQATVARSNKEQSFIEFISMEGPYSIRVPNSELKSRLESPYILDITPTFSESGGRHTTVEFNYKDVTGWACSCGETSGYIPNLREN